MLFHHPDTTQERLNSCLKRARFMAKPGEIDESHALAPAFLNMTLALDASDLNHEDRVFDLIVLDWFALKVDEFSKDHMLTQDPVVCAMLAEWQKRVPFGLVK